MVFVPAVHGSAPLFCRTKRIFVQFVHFAIDGHSGHRGRKEGQALTVEHKSD